MTRLTATDLTTPRLTLTPLVEDDARDMVDVLADPRIYLFTGGEALTLDELRARYARQVVGASPDGSQSWLNWIIRVDGRAIGFVQATIERQADATTADIAWVLTPSAHGQGFATEAALAATGWLARLGVTRFGASIHPEHAASAAVARRLGMSSTGLLDDEGEMLWMTEVQKTIPEEM